MDKAALDQTVLNIEFLLISVIQGVAFSSLATFAAAPLTHGDFQYWLYILSGFLIILIFWSQAIVHAISFIDWPLDIGHGLLYFLASFIEVIAFNQLTNPLGWFVSLSLFFGCAGLLYLYDLRLIKSRKLVFADSPARQKLYQHIIKRQTLELYTIVPAGILFNAVAVGIFVLLPAQSQHWHVALAAVETLICVLGLFNALDSFRHRVHLITQSLSE